MSLETLFAEVEPLLESWVASVALVVAALLAGVLAARVAVRALDRWSQHTRSRKDDIIMQEMEGPIGWLLPLGAVQVAAPFVALPDGALDVVRHTLLIATIGIGAWLLRRAVNAVERVVEQSFDVNADNNLEARRVQTQMQGLHNIASFLIVLLAIAFALMTFKAVREFGVTLLASAGVAGIVIGFAAQRSIATIVAGVQIALTQPIRVDDVVIVEGEWGWIEEIRLTYVVVRIWDLRRLVLPITYFIEKPFQNWTRTSADILGTVYLYTDYTVPVDRVRTELKRILDETELWDGKAWGLQVTNATERTLELRALMSAADSGKAWDMRCLVREKLVEFIQREYPGTLPRIRGGSPREAVA